MAQAINRYKADLREIQFLLFEQFKLGELLGKAPFEAWGEDEVNAGRSTRPTVRAARCSGRSTRRRSRGLPARGRPGHHADRLQGRVEASSTRRAGRRSRVDAEHGGQGAPLTLQVLVEEFLSGANTALQHVPGPRATARPRSSSSSARRSRSERYAAAACSTARGAARCASPSRTPAPTSARRRTTATQAAPTARYDIKRHQDLHLRRRPRPRREHHPPGARARRRRAAPAPRASRSSSCPKIRVDADGTLGERNDVTVGAHRAQDGHQRLGDLRAQLRRERRLHRRARSAPSRTRACRRCSSMMNGARIAVGIQGVARRVDARTSTRSSTRRSASRARASRTGRTPTAPRVPIIEHADVRRMLLDMKARVEGIRALVVKLARHQDAAHASAAARTTRRPRTTRARSICSCRW